ncbi:MAG: (d)CMP kinase [Suipraeoptans sp.]
MGYQIAIDGPAGAGKSTIAKKVAGNRGAIYVDTGALYRAIGYDFIINNVDVDDLKSIAIELNKIDVKLQYVNNIQKVLLNDEDITAYIRKEEVGNMASKASAVKAVREKLLDLQRNIADEHDVVMDGRDIGSFVLPEANVKVYLTASVATRAKRRYDELIQKGLFADLESIKYDIEERDYRDMNRETAPLKQAEGAVLIDSSNMSIEEVVNAILALCEKK